MKLKNLYKKEYRIWKALRARCNAPCYSNSTYQKKGIKCCRRWQSFEHFISDMGKCPEGYSIDRIDNNKGYYKDNCRWADYVIQQNNKRTNARYNYNGKNYTVPEIITTGIPDSDRNYNSIKSSIYKGKDIKDAILSPERKNVVNPVSFYDESGNRIQDPYNNRHDDLQ